MKTNKQKIVVVGGGFGGAKTALNLSKDRRFDVTLISENPNFRYYPSLYHTATGGSSDVSVIPLKELLDEKRIKIVNKTAESVDRARKILKTSDAEEYEYDFLILATGVVTNYFNIPGLEKLSYGIKSLKDAEELKNHLHKQIIDKRKPDINYIVVGGGPSGIELAGVLGDYIKYICNKHGIKARKLHIDLVEAAPRLVPRMPKDVSRKLAKRLRKKGVKLYLNAKVEGQTADGLTVNGKPIRSHTVVWTAGTANNPFFTNQNFQVSSNRKVRVDQYLQAEPGIFVIGDNADTPYSGMAQTAIYDADYVSEALREIVINHRSPKPYKAKQPIYVVPAGPNWAAVLWGKVRLYGRLGWAMRRAADFLGYSDYEPVFKATKRWLTEFEREDMCEVCQKSAV